MTQTATALGETHKVESSDLTSEERALLGVDGEPEEPIDDGPDDGMDDEEAEAIPLEEIPARDPNAIPDWAIIPANAKLPDGRQVIFVRLRAGWTDTPHKGDRQCIMWNLTEADEKLALRRTRGDSLRTIDELTKQAIRIVDGQKADWTGKVGPGSVNRFWNDVGTKCRQQLKNMYVKAHALEPSEIVDFFSTCVVVRSVAT